jgi:hypothetical protein
VGVSVFCSAQGQSERHNKVIIPGRNPDRAWRHNLYRFRGSFFKAALEFSQRIRGGCVVIIW